MSYFRITSESGKREKWTVKVKASRLEACCIERMKYHKERMGFWSAERVKSDKALKEKGITIQQFEVTGGTRSEAKLDPSLVARLGECQAKEKSNSEAFAKFGAYKAMFKLLGDSEVELNADDVLYFNIEGSDVGKEDTDDQ